MNPSRPIRVPLLFSLAALCLAAASALAQPRPEVVVQGLSDPWSLAFLPAGRMLLTERGGTLRIAGRDGRLSSPLAGLPAIDAVGQCGLLDGAPTAAAELRCGRPRLGMQVARVGPMPASRHCTSARLDGGAPAREPAVSVALPVPGPGKSAYGWPVELYTVMTRRRGARGRPEVLGVGTRLATFAPHRARCGEGRVRTGLRPVAAGAHVPRSP